MCHPMWPSVVTSADAGPRTELQRWLCALARAPDRALSMTHLPTQRSASAWHHVLTGRAWAA